MAKFSIGRNGIRNGKIKKKLVEKWYEIVN